MQNADSFRNYMVQSISFPWLHGDGFLAGRAVCRVALGDSAERRARPYTMHAVRDRVAAFIPQRTPDELRPDACRWVAVTGTTSEADNELLLILRHTLGLQVYIEADGRSSMIDATGRLPVWDHVCVRTSDGDIAMAQSMLFHSVVWEGPFDYASIRAMDDRLHTIGFNGDRFIRVTDKRMVPPEFRKLSRDWRLTAPLGKLVRRAEGRLRESA